MQSLPVFNKETGCGDCIETDFDPADARYYRYTLPFKFIIIRIEMNTWRIWKKE